MDPFQLLIKPAAGDCNLACEYCFYREVTPELYPAEKTHRMTLETMQTLVREFLAYRFPETIFCWQGGEPTLMGLPFFQAVVEAQMNYGQPGQVVGNAFQTNGILVNEDWARFFAEYRVVVGLSLDGPREIHDHYRRNLGGAGTFEKVMAAAELFQKRQVAFNILCVVNRFNQDRAAEVYRFFRAQGFDYLQFIPCLETDPATGEVLPFSATPDGLARFFQDLFAEYKRDGYPQVSERNLDAVMNLHLQGRSGMCTLDAKCGNYLVVEYNGDVYPCDFFVEQEWRLGNLRDKKLHEFFAHPLRKKFSAAKPRRDPECRACRWLEWCHGGCLKDRLPNRAEGRGRTHFCEAYRALFASTFADMEAWAAPLKAQSAVPAVAAAHPGRNDPCPCGSGKKFKKCCGNEKLGPG